MIRGRRSDWGCSGTERVCLCQVEANRFDLIATLGTLVATEAVGTMPKTPSEMRGLGVPKSELNPYTGQLSRWSKRFDVPAARIFGRTVAGIVIGTVATGALIFEGFLRLGRHRQGSLGRDVFLRLANVTRNERAGYGRSRREGA